MNIKQKEKLTIIVSKYKCRLRLDLPWDASLEDLEFAFRTILTFLTFTSDSIDEFFGKEEK